MYKYNGDDEILTPFSDIEILNHLIDKSNAIPHWLRGTYISNRLFPLKINNEKIHWFDEPSFLHSFQFQDKGIHYSRKFLKSEAYKKIFTEHKFNYVGFSTKTDRLIWSLLKSIFSLKKNT